MIAIQITSKIYESALYLKFYSLKSLSIFVILVELSTLISDWTMIIMMLVIDFSLLSQFTNEILFVLLFVVSCL